MRLLRIGHHTLLVVTLTTVMSACSQADPGRSPAAPSSSVAALISTSSSTPLSPTSTLASTVLVPATTSEEAGSVSVPKIAAPVIDGVLEFDEWDGAAVFPMSDGASISLMYSDGSLYLAVAGDEIGSVNVLIGSEDDVWILHSSAALGSALYEKGTERWELVHGFSWCCRSRRDDEARLVLLEEEGWQANIGFTGDPGTVEYQIAVPWQGASLAVSSIRDQEDMGFWPADLTEEARLELVGVPPEVRAYDIALWPVLTPAGG